jgi:hypothetical protein
VPLDVVRATVNGAAGAPTDLRHFGLDVRGVGACDGATRLAKTFDGVTMPSPERTMDLVRNGKLVRVDRRGVAAVLAGELVEHPIPAVENLPVTTRLRAGAQAVVAAGRGVGLVLADGTLWGLPDGGIAGGNDSPVREITPAQWDAYPRGSSLVG